MSIISRKFVWAGVALIILATAVVMIYIVTGSFKSDSRLTNQASPSPIVPYSPEYTVATCSPPGTATCDGHGRPISGRADSTQSTASVAGLAPGVRKFDSLGVKTITLSSGGTNGLAVDSETGLVYTVTNSTVGNWCGKAIATQSDMLHIINPAQAKVIAAVATERGPVWPFVDVKNNRVYVASSSDGYVAIHARSTGEKMGTITVGGLPHDIALDPESNLLFVSNTKNGSQKYVAVVNAATQNVVSQHESAALPHRIALDSAKRLAYVMSVESGIISVFHTQTGASAGQFSSGGRGTMAFSPKQRLIFVPKSGKAGEPESIQVVNADTQQAVGAIGPFLSNAGHQAFGLAVDDARGLLFASIGDSNYVGVADIATRKPLGVIDIGDCAWGVQTDEARGTVYVTGVTKGTLSSIDIAEIIQQIR